MSEKFPTDEFDNAPLHGGRHRKLRTSKDRVVEFFKLLAMAAVVGGVGYIGLQLVQSSSIFSGFVAQQDTSANAIEVKVYDGTADNVGGTNVAKALFLAGFKVGDAQNLIDSDGKEVLVEKSTILITNEKYRSDASTISSETGIKQIELTTTYKEPISVVVGTDYREPTK
jgi:hypothetical protein